MPSGPTGPDGPGGSSVPSEASDVVVGLDVVVVLAVFPVELEPQPALARAAATARAPPIRLVKDEWDTSGISDRAHGTE
jgi:hypothetical protein